ncbi:ciliary microtubule associated protein 1B isoform X2 [Prinia subflava]
MSKEPWVGPWRPHRPRVPVAIRLLTPGPKYDIPSGMGCDRRDPCSRRAPAYSFGLRLGSPEAPRSPGPQYLVPPGSTARGRDRVPGFTMGGRPRERRASDTPGPAHYAPERATRATLPSAPTCSLRSRSRAEKGLQTPGPASYQLPAVMGPRQVTKASAPQYSFTGRGGSIFDDKKRTPGPSRYRTVDTDVYMVRAPRCTMAGRSRPAPASDTPGPSDYSLKESQKPGQTFGIRYSEAVIPVMDWRL